MLQWVGKMIAGDFIQTELGKLRGDIADIVGRGIVQLKQGSIVKAEVYRYFDGILAEGQNMSKDKLDAWWVERRAQLKAWAGQ